MVDGMAVGNLLVALGVVGAFAWRVRGRAGSPWVERGLRRRWLSAGGVAALLAALVLGAALGGRAGPLWLETLDFCLILFCATPLLVLGEARDAAVPPRSAGGAGGWLGLGVYLVALVLWRLPATVDGLAGTGWLTPLEVLTLVPGGWLLWRDVVGLGGSAAMRQLPRRMLFAAFGMWSAWIVAYALGFSGADTFSAYHAGALGRVGDQEVSTAIFWAFAAAGFMPVVFVNLGRWLGGGDADERPAVVGLGRVVEPDGGWQWPPPG
jgi:cytochrome c oxidase assembly factor CtaG